MRLQIKYFASVRETLNQDSQDIESAAPTVQALLNELMASSTAHAEALGHPRLCAAVNHTMVKRDFTLSSGDEVAFFPPVTGG